MQPTPPQSRERVSAHPDHAPALVHGAPVLDQGQPFLGKSWGRLNGC